MITFPISGVETYWWLPSLVAFIISFFTSTGGLSGAFLLLPFQVSVLGFSSPSVSPTNLVFNIFGIPGGMYRYIHEKRMVWPLAITIILGSLPGMVAGACIRVLYFADPRNFKLFVGLVLMYVGSRLVINILKNTDRATPSQDGGFAVKTLSFKVTEIVYEFNGVVYRTSTPAIFFLALAVGVIGGAYGIGGGAIIAPILVTIFGLPVYTIAGAALFGTFVTSVFGLAVYSFIMPALLPGFQPVYPDLLLGISLGIGGLAGIYLGARLQKYFAPQAIKIILAASLAVVVVRYVGGYFF